MSISTRRLMRKKDPDPVFVSPTADAGSLPVGQASYPIPTTGTVLYVSPSGSDTSGAGSAGAPYQTFAKALSSATSGTTIVLREGVYHEGGSNPTSAIGIQVSKNNITIQNYPGEAVWFDGSSVYTGWTQSGSTWSIPWTKQFDHSPTQTRGAADGTTPGWIWINPNYPCAPFPEQVFIDGVQQVQVNSLTACTAGKFYIEGTTAVDYLFTPTTLYIGSDPTGKEVHITDRHVFMNLGVGNTGLTVRGIGIRRYGNSLPQFSVLRLDGNNITTNCLVENVVLEDIATLATHSNQCHGNTYRHVTIRSAGYGGTGGFRSDNLTFDKMLIEHTNTEGFNSSPGSSAIKVTQSQHVTLKNSILRDSKCKGIWFDMSVYDMKVVNNDFLRNKDTDAFFEISGTGICANNLFVDNPAEAIKVNNTDDMRLWNNTIVRCGNLAQRLTPDTSNLGNGDRRPLAIYQEERRPATTSYGQDGRYPLSHPMYTTYMTWEIGAIDIHNNIVTDTPANAYALFCIDDLQRNQSQNRLLSAYGVTMNGNAFHWASAPSVTPPYPYIFPALTTGGNPVIYSTHAAMVSATSLNTNGTEVNPKGSGTSIPSLVDASYHVSASYAALHSKATALDVTIATLVGQPTGTKQAGCWR